MSDIIQRALRSRAVFQLSTLVLTSMFWWSGLLKLWDFAGARREMEHFGLEPSALFAAATIAVQLGGSALIVVGRRRAWLGAAALVAFTLATIPLAHPFWALDGPAAFLEKAFAQEHVSITGALVLAAILAELKFGSDHA
jgi:transmembrane protein